MVCFMGRNTVKEPSLVGIPTHVLMMSNPEVMNWKLSFQRSEIMDGMGE